MRMQYDVFISYKSQYVKIVNAVVHLLEEEGIKCWYAPRDLDNKGAGKDYDDEIVDAITAARVVIVILCDEALESKWVKIEITQAQEKNKLIIPYVISELSVSNGLRARLQSKHWIDAYPNPERNFALLVNNVKLELNKALEGENEAPLYRTIQEIDFNYDFDYEEGGVLYQAKEYNEAIRAYLASAERGNKKAQAILCDIFYELENKIEIIADDIWDVVERLAKMNYDYAQFIMHTKYYKDFANSIISFEYLKKAIKNNDIPLAFLRLGIHYGWGMGVKQNHTLASHYYRKAEQFGCTRAYSYLGQEYRWGNEKNKIDLAKSLEYYLKGAEAGDRRSIEGLVSYYNQEIQDFNKAKEWAQKAIDLGFDEGYCLMGDTELAENDNQPNANSIKWYKEAARRDVKQAFFDLAYGYWNNDNFSEAYKFAQQGYRVHDSGSIYLLGYLNETGYNETREINYPEAWRYYKEQFERFGTGANHLGRLYMDLDYQPENFDVNDLVKFLEIGAGNNDEEALRQLVRLFSEEKYGIKNIDKIARLYKQGAELGYPEYMYKYGLSFLENSEKIFNPFIGIEWLEKAAKKQYNDAIYRLIILYQEDSYADKERLYEWLAYVIRNDICDIKILPVLLSDGENATDVDTFTDFLIRILTDLQSKQVSLSEREQISHIVKILIANHIEQKRLINVETIQICKDIIEKNDIFEWWQDKNRLHAIQVLYPKFNPTLIEYSNEYNNFEQYYRFYRASKWEYALQKQDAILTQLFAPMMGNKSYVKLLNVQDLCASGLAEYWKNGLQNFTKEYKMLCERFQRHPIICKETLEYRETIPYFASTLAQEIKKQGLRCLLSLDSNFKSLQINVINIPDEQILTIAEKCSDELIQSFLISFVEIMIEADEILMNNYYTYKYYTESNYQKLSEQLNNYVDCLEKNHIEHSFPKYTPEKASQIFLSAPVTQVEEDFDKLLNVLISKPMSEHFNDLEDYDFDE